MDKDYFYIDEYDDEEPIFVEKTFQGAWKLSTRKYGNLIHNQYMDYSLEEALEKFNEKISNYRG